MIRRAAQENIVVCRDIIWDSELFRTYFVTRQIVEDSLRSRFGAEELYLSLDEEGQPEGVLWFTWQGAFHSFPYLHILAVKESSRSRGVGSRLLMFFEEQAFAKANQAFLVVAHTNPAKALYERQGYEEVGAIPGLYRSEDRVPDAQTPPGRPTR